MAATTWHERLDEVDTTEQIVGVAKDFVAQFNPYELHALPERCRPPSRFVDAEDITMLAYELAAHSCGEEPRQAALVAKLTQFFAHASMRLAQVTARRDDPDEERQSA